MIAPSRQEQMMIEALLGVCAPLSDITIVSTFRGVTESEVDALLAGGTVKAPKLAGAIILVGQPAEVPSEKTESRATNMETSLLQDRREHTVRIIEQVKVNRRPGWESNAAKLACGLTADEIKDRVKAALHDRFLGAATLVHAASDPYEDAKGGYGWDVKFRILSKLTPEVRCARPEIAQALVPATAAVLRMDFTAYAGGSLAISLGQQGQFIADGQPPGAIPADLTAPGGWTRRDAGLVVTFSCDTPGPCGLTATIDGVLDFTFADGADAFMQVTISGNTAILYTLDGLPPVSGGATVQTYAGPFTATPGLTLLAACISDTKAISDFAQATVR